MPGAAMIRGALALAVAFGACGPTYVVPAEAPEPASTRYVRPPAPPGHAWVLIGKNDMGFAVCDAEIGVTSYVRTNLIGGPEQAQVADHETDHETTMGLFPDCDAFWRWFGEDPAARRLEVEARAYCASVRADMRSGRFTYVRALHVYANKLADQSGTTTGLAIREMFRFCPPVVP